MSHKTYAYISDGGHTGRNIAGSRPYCRLPRIAQSYYVLWSNNISCLPKTSAVTVEDTAMKYNAWGLAGAHYPTGTIRTKSGWRSWRQLRKRNGPTLIIGKKLTMGKGAVDAKRRKLWKVKPPRTGCPLEKRELSFEKSIENLSGNPADPFVVFPEIADIIKKYCKINQLLQRNAKRRKKMGGSKSRAGEKARSLLLG